MRHHIQSTRVDTSTRNYHKHSFQRNTEPCNEYCVPINNPFVPLHGLQAERQKKRARTNRTGFRWTSVISCPDLLQHKLPTTSPPRGNQRSNRPELSRQRTFLRALCRRQPPEKPYTFGNKENGTLVAYSWIQTTDHL